MPSLSASSLFETPAASRAGARHSPNGVRGGSVCPLPCRQNNPGGKIYGELLAYIYAILLNPRHVKIFDFGLDAFLRNGGRALRRIPDAELARLKRDVALADLCRDYGIELKPHGADLVGLCPFH